MTVLRTLVAALALLAAAAAPAEPPETPKSPPTAEAGRVDHSTPRSAMRGFLVATREGRHRAAAAYLDLARIPAEERGERGPELARELKLVLDRTLWVELDRLSDEPEGEPDDGLPAGQDRIGTIETAGGPVELRLERTPGPEGAWLWRVAASSVARVPALYDEFGYGRLGAWLPAVFFEARLLEIQLWQALGLLLLALVSWLASWAIVRLAVAILRPLVGRSGTDLDDRLFEATLGPARLALGVMIFSAGSLALGLAVPVQRAITGAARVAAIAAVAWLVLRLVDLVGDIVRTRLEARGERAAEQLVPLGRKTVKVLVVALAVMAGLDSFGFDVTALLAGLGIGGLAVALALQKTLENFFGGATLLADRPVRVGDFCRFGEKTGTVEEIGMRSTRVRTLDRTLVTVPNAEFATMQLENYSRRDRIWYHPTIGLRYETTAAQLRQVLAQVRDMLRGHSRVDPEGARVRFTSFGAYSLDLEIFAYVRVTDYAEYLEVAEDLNLRIMDLVEKAGAGFAFPSNTTYLAKDEYPPQAAAS